MTDVFTKRRRSEIMSRIRSKNTSPETTVLAALKRTRRAYRLHDDSLPGHPDIVLPNSKCAIFVNGCFWHRHKGCKYAQTPKSNRSYWSDKFSQTRLRDQRNSNRLRRMNWRVLTVWECQTRDAARVETRVVKFLQRVPSTKSRNYA